MRATGTLSPPLLAPSLKYLPPLSLSPCSPKALYQPVSHYAGMSPTRALLYNYASKLNTVCHLLMHFPQQLPSLIIMLLSNDKLGHVGALDGENIKKKQKHFVPEQMSLLQDSLNGMPYFCGQRRIQMQHVRLVRI